MSGATVAVWEDQSGNGRHAGQSDASRLPLFVANRFNGQPALRFDGIQQHLAFTLPINGLTEMTVMMVAANATDHDPSLTGANHAALAWGESALWGTSYLSPFQSQVSFRFGTEQAGNRPIYTRPSSLGDCYSLSTSIHSGATDSLYVNGALVFSEGGKLASLSGAADTALIGAAWDAATFFHGDVAEIIVYPAALDTAQRQQVENYLLGKYGICTPAANPSATPTATATITPTPTATPLSTSNPAVVVNIVGDAPDADLADGICETTIPGECSLRAAIQQANAAAGADAILFNIPGGGPHTIAPASALPNITGPVSIDGTSEPDYAGAPVIVLDGSAAGLAADGLRLDAGSSGSTIRGLAVNRFGQGIAISFSSTNTIAGCYIGLAADGVTPQGNSSVGIQIMAESAENLIGGDSPEDRNVIAGTSGAGVSLIGVGASGNRVVGNYIGTDASGTIAVGNTIGVRIAAFAIGNTIGNDTEGGNLIAGNSAMGMFIDSSASSQMIQGNLIGLDVTGAAALSNGGSGITISAQGVVVGGTTAAARNVISGNAQAGVVIDGGTAVLAVVQGNFIGTSADGSAAIGNGGGVLITGGASNNRIGGTTAAARNLIAGNTADGVAIFGNGTSDNLVQGNWIGINAAGTGVIGQGAQGVWIGYGASGNLIGGTVDGAGNVIGGSTFAGVEIRSSAGSNLVQGNFIGTDATGARSFANGTAGVFIQDGARNNSIGGATAGAGNLIRFNAAGGVVVIAPASVGNAILGNQIIDNNAPGIDLGWDGVTANDPGDADDGPNGLQNAPVLTGSSGSSGQISVTGTLSSQPLATYRIELFAGANADPNGPGAAQRYLGAVDVTTDETGSALFFTTLTAVAGAGEGMIATATDSAGNTSEFSAPILIVAGSAPPPATALAQAHIRPHTPW